VRATQNSKVMLAGPQPIPDDMRARAEALVSLADGDHDESLRSELFAVTDALAGEAVHAKPPQRQPVRTSMRVEAEVSIA
jgi:hypothetical protein